jgi:hypothetical protein
MRAAALDVDVGSVWIERVVCDTRPARPEWSSLGAATGPLADLAREIDELGADPARLEAFLTELPGLAELTRKVRPSTLDEQSPARHATLLADAKELLLARLSELTPP